MVYLLSFSAVAFAAVAFVAFTFADTGLDLPNEPLNILPFLVFLSPRPIEILFIVVLKMLNKKKQDTSMYLAL
jgi:hypothetical protein